LSANTTTTDVEQSDNAPIVFADYDCHERFNSNISIHVLAKVKGETSNQKGKPLGVHGTNKEKRYSPETTVLSQGTAVLQINIT